MSDFRPSIVAQECFVAWVGKVNKANPGRIDYDQICFDWPSPELIQWTFEQYPTMFIGVNYVFKGYLKQYPLVSAQGSFSHMMLVCERDVEGYIRGVLQKVADKLTEAYKILSAPPIKSNVGPGYRPRVVEMREDGAVVIGSFVVYKCLPPWSGEE